MDAGSTELARQEIVIFPRECFSSSMSVLCGPEQETAGDARQGTDTVPVASGCMSDDPHASFGQGCKDCIMLAHVAVDKKLAQCAETHEWDIPAHKVPDAAAPSVLLMCKTMAEDAQ